HVRGVRLAGVVDDRQPGPRRLPDGDAVAAPLAALVERGGERDRLPARVARGLALQSLPALLGGHHRPARRLLLPVPGGVFRLGHAPGAGGEAMARPALTLRGQVARMVLAI